MQIITSKDNETVKNIKKLLRRRHRADADHVGRGRAGFVAHHGRAAASVCRDGYVDIWIDDSDADAAWRSAFRKPKAYTTPSRSGIRK